MKANVLKWAGAFFMSAFLLNSCVDSDIDPIGYGDAFIIVEIVGQDTLKGLGLHAFSYTEFTAVNVQLSSDQNVNYTLQPYLGYGQDFTYNTPLAQFKQEIPATGDYVFNATFRGGQTHTFFDKLYTTLVYPPRITKGAYVVGNQKMEIDWIRVSNADSYNVKLLNANGDILFVSPLLNRVTDFFSFDKNSQGWQTSTFPSEGQQLVIEVSSYLLEPGTYNNELQSIGKSRTPVTWGN